MITESEKKSFLGSLALIDDAARRCPKVENEEIQSFNNSDSNPLIADAARRAQTKRYNSYKLY